MSEKALTKKIDELIKAVTPTSLIDNKDHDTITTLVNNVSNLEKKMDEGFKNLKYDIKEIKDGTAGKIEKLEIRADVQSLDIARIKTWGSAGLLVMGIAQFLISKFV